MKTEERKKEDCELLDEFVNDINYWPIPLQERIKNAIKEFKSDNDLLPKRIELSKEEWNERIGEVQVKINELEEKLNELRKLV
jgi:hypothetical protein